MNTRISQIFLLIFCLKAFTACEESFDEINTNEKVPIEIIPGNTLPNVIFNVANAHTNFIGQLDEVLHFRVNSDGGSQFNINNADQVWREVYASFSNIIEINKIVETDPSLQAYNTASKILRAYYAGILTELYIDIPQSNAGEGLAGSISPAYDTQEDVFDFILEELKSANEAINLNGEMSFTQGGDLIYDGDIKRWQKLANALRLRYLLKISNVRDVRQEMLEIMQNPNLNPIFESHEDNALLDFTGAFPFTGFFDQLTASQFEIRHPGEFYVDVLSPSDDPRLDFFYDLPKNGTSSEHLGIPTGLSGADIKSTFPNAQQDFSVLNDDFLNTKGKIDYVLMSYTELNFILAEAALKGLIDANAEIYYNLAVNSSLTYWGLEIPNDFLNRPNVIWDATLETLMLQKWVASYGVYSFESWSDYKRTGLPAFDLNVNFFPVTNDQIPTRMIYPVNEQSLNTTHYNTAVERIGGDNLLVNHWYQGN